MWYRNEISSCSLSMCFRSDSNPPCILYHFNGLVSHEYDSPLFQLSMVDVMASSVLGNTVIPFDWLYIEEEIGHGLLNLGHNSHKY